MVVVFVAEGSAPSYGKVYHHHIHPEGWEDKKATHIPTLVVKGDVAYVHVDHVMTEEHYINAIYVKADIHGRTAQTIYFKDLDASAPKAVARFQVCPNSLLLLFQNCFLEFRGSY